MTDFEDHFEDMTEETEEFTEDIEKLIEDELGTSVTVQQVRYQPEQGRYFLNVNPEAVGENFKTNWVFEPKLVAGSTSIRIKTLVSLVS